MNTTSTSPQMEGMEDQFKDELLHTFLEEFEELMELYEDALNEIRRIQGDKQQAYEDLFRVYHTLKGDSGYFEEFSEFTNFAKHYCDLLRNPNDSVINDEQLRQELRLNFSRLSSALSALNNGKSLQAFRFKLFLKNF